MLFLVQAFTVGSPISSALSNWTLVIPVSPFERSIMVVTLAGYCTCSTRYPPQYPIYFCPPTEFRGISFLFQPIDGVLDGKMTISICGFAKKNGKKTTVHGRLCFFTFDNTFSGTHALKPQCRQHTLKFDMYGQISIFLIGSLPP